MKKVNIFQGLTPEELTQRKKSAQPAFIKPMLATLTENYFSRNDWIYEHKFDGERCLVFKKNGNVQLLSRNNKEMNNQYPELVTALIKQAADNFIIDGEIVALDKSGVSDFELLQGRINVQKDHKIEALQKTVPVLFNIFDLMYVDGYDIRNLPLLTRKAILKKLLKYNGMLLYTEHKVGDGIEFFKQACKLHWEGLIAKRSASPYVGVRSPDWLKFKCIMKQELVIGGYTQPQGSRTDFGALLVGYYANGNFMYAGKVGTGYSQETLAMLGKKLQKLERATCPFSNYDETVRGVHWVKPQLVAEFQFANWTNAGKLRVGRYKGLRDDKNARDVVKELPKRVIIKK